jgi:hypothetical protein
MISLSAATLMVARKTKRLIRNIVVHEMRKSAAGYGIYNDNLFPDSKPEPTIKLQVSRRRLRIPKH